MTPDELKRQCEQTTMRAAADRDIAIYERDSLQVERDYFRDIVRAAVDAGEWTPALNEAGLVGLEWSDREQVTE